MLSFLRTGMCLTLTLGFLSILSGSASGQAEMTEAKRKLIAELAPVAESRKQMETVLEAMLAMTEAQYPATIDQALAENKGMSAKEKADLKATMVENYSIISKKFRERLPQAIDLSKYVEESVYPIYAKFFTEEELRDLVAFYKSPTGVKSMAIMPELYVESMKAAQEKLLPAVEKLIKEIVAEELKLGDGDRKEIIQQAPPQPKRRKATR